MASQTYCKRLRFACAEHYNDFMGSEMKICGYPLSWADSSSMRLRDMFSNLEDIVSGGICTRPRNSCHDHKYWEQVAFLKKGKKCLRNFNIKSAKCFFDVEAKSDIEKNFVLLILKFLRHFLFSFKVKTI
jgi:hypothetical protein